MSPSRFYISITGLELKSFTYLPRFMMHTVASIQQAKSAPGNVYTSSNRIQGTYHTLTVWESREDMLRYVRSGAHLEAMKSMKMISSYAKTYGYEGDKIPSWDEARDLWERNGRVLIGERKPFDVLAASRDEQGAQDLN